MGRTFLHPSGGMCILLPRVPPCLFVFLCLPRSIPSLAYPLICVLRGLSQPFPPETTPNGAPNPENAPDVLLSTWSHRPKSLSSPNRGPTCDPYSPASPEGLPSDRTSRHSPKPGALSQPASCLCTLSLAHPCPAFLLSLAHAPRSITSTASIPKASAPSILPHS